MTAPAARARPATPSEIATEETLRFLERALPPAPARVLEVGCGDGLVALALAAAGYDVTALDLSIERPETGAALPSDVPRRAGEAPGRVRWVEADFLYHAEDEPYAALVFTRSLHHMAPVEATLDHALALLHPGGLLAAEEFAYDRVNIQTARWLYDLESVLVAADLLAPVGGAAEGAAEGEGAAVSAEGNPLGRWRREHTHDPPLQTGHAILGAARERFELTAVEEAPYLYRYLCERLEPTERGARVARRALELESRLIRERDITAAGLRVIGRRPG